MPHTELHKKKRNKNLAFLALIFAWVAMIWIVSMIKIAHSAEFDQSNMYINQRSDFYDSQAGNEARWFRRWDRREKRRENTEKVRDHNRNVHMDYNQRAETVWHKKYEVMQPLRNILENVDQRKKEAYREELDSRPEQWHSQWERDDFGTDRSLHRKRERRIRK